MKRGRLLGSYLRQPPAIRRLALEATCLLALARAVVLFVPMRHWQGGVKAEPAVLRRGSPTEGLHREVGRVVHRVALRMPFDASCLSQALACRWMVRRRGIGSRLHFGVRRQPDGTVALHAWLTVDGECVVGGPDVKGFSALQIPQVTQKARHRTEPR